MARGIEAQEDENYKSRVFQLGGMHENAGRHAKSMSFDSGSSLECADDDWMKVRSQGSRPLNDNPLERQQIGSSLKKNDRVSGLQLSKDGAAAAKQAKDKQPSGNISRLFVCLFFSH